MLRTARFSWQAVVAAALIFVFVAVQAFLAARLNINWDEFWFLERIYRANAGTLADPFQNFHVHLLGWLASLPLGAIDQIVAGRFFMLACQLVALGCLFSISLRLTDLKSALLVVALWFGSSWSLVHGASFRTDALAAALLMAALAVLFASPRPWRSVLAGFLAAIALLVTVKGAFYLPVFVAAFWHSWQTYGLAQAIRHFALAAIALAIAGIGLWLWHSSALGGWVAAGELSQTVAVTGGAASRVLGEDEWFPRSHYALIWFQLGLPTALAIFAGVALAGRDFFRREDRSLAIIAALSVLPLLSLLFYRNAFPYFFPFIVLPVMIAALPAIRRLTASQRPLAELTLAAVACAVILQIVPYWQSDQVAQRAYTAEIERMFPEPVAYISRSTMLPGYPKAGFFMSTLELENVRRSGRPILAEAIKREAPPLLLVNSPAIADALAAREPGEIALLPADRAALRENYIAHWGDIWVAGKRLEGGSGSFAVVIAGQYTLECGGSRIIDGLPAECGSAVSIDRGLHRWSGGAAVLRWGRSAPLTRAAPAKPIYHPL